MSDKTRSEEIEATEGTVYGKMSTPQSSWEVLLDHTREVQNEIGNSDTEIWLLDVVICLLEDKIHQTKKRAN